MAKVYTLITEVKLDLGVGTAVISMHVNGLPKDRMKEVCVSLTLLFLLHLWAHMFSIWQKLFALKGHSMEHMQLQAPSLSLDIKHSSVTFCEHIKTNSIIAKHSSIIFSFTSSFCCKTMRKNVIKRIVTAQHVFDLYEIHNGNRN